MKSFERTRQPVPMKTAEAIHQMIRERNLRSGDQLPSQRELSQELRVSRPSLREALSMLETLGVIVIQAGRGVFVAEEDEATASAEATWRFGEQYSLREVFEIRRAIEGAAAALAVSRMPPGNVELLASMSLEIETAARNRDVVQVAENDVRFHDMIFEHCGNRLFQDLHAHVRRMVIESQHVPMLERSRLVETALEHRRLVEAFQASNPDAARRAMEQHIRAAAGRAGIFL